MNGLLWSGCSSTMSPLCHALLTLPRYNCSQLGENYNHGVSANYFISILNRISWCISAVLLFMIFSMEAKSRMPHWLIALCIYKNLKHCNQENLPGKIWDGLLLLWTDLNNVWLFLDKIFSIVGFHLNISTSDQIRDPSLPFTVAGLSAVQRVRRLFRKLYVVKHFSCQ